MAKAKKSDGEKSNVTRYVVGGLIGLGVGAGGLFSALALPVIVGNMFAPLADAYDGKERSILGTAIRLGAGVLFLAPAIWLGNKYAGGKAAIGVGVLGSAGVAGGVLWPVVAPRVRGYLGTAMDVEPAGVGSLLEGAGAYMDAAVAGLDPGGVESLIQDEPAGLADRYVAVTSSGNSLF